MQRLVRNRNILDASEKPYLRYFSPITALNLKYNSLFLERFARGRLLDAGAGHLHNKPLAVPYCDQYVSMDITALVDDLDYLGDIQQMGDTPSGSYDTVLLTHVLEHVPRPDEALRECHRILSPDGILIGSTPHLSRLHGEPHDYFRFTKYGLAYLVGDVAGFNEWGIVPAGGVLAFLGHQFATLFVCSTLSIPVAGDLLARFNHTVNLRLIRVLDRWFGVQGHMACMYYFLAAKDRFTPEQRVFIEGIRGAMLSS